MSDIILKIEHLNIEVAGKKINDDVSFDLFRGQIVGVIGASGVGKSTMLFAISGLLNSQYKISGSIQFEDNINILDVNKRKRQLICAKNSNIVFQDALNSLDPYETVGSQLREIIEFKEISSFKHSKRSDKIEKSADDIHNRVKHSQNFKSKNKSDYTKKRIYELLDLVGLENELSILNKYPYEISGGMAQKVSLAFAFVGRPKIILADEPTSSMDAIYQLEFVKTLEKIAKKLDIAVLFVSHDLALISNFCERILVLENGRLAEDKCVMDLLDNPESNMANNMLKASRKILLYEDNKS